MIDIHNSNAMTLRSLSQPPPQPATDSSEVSRLLVDLQRGDKFALHQLMPLVYREIRNVATGYLQDERRNHTLQPTALIQESYLRLVEQDFSQSQSRAHFFAVAAKLLRQILVDQALRRQALKRGGTQDRLSVAESIASPVSNDDERLLMLDEAMTKLSLLDERKSRVVEMRVFGEMKLSDIAVAMGVSEPTIKRDMRMARAWLRIELGG